MILLLAELCDVWEFQRVRMLIWAAGPDFWTRRRCPGRNVKMDRMSRFRDQTSRALAAALWSCFLDQAPSVHAVRRAAHWLLHVPSPFRVTVIRPFRPAIVIVGLLILSSRPRCAAVKRRPSRSREHVACRWRPGHGTCLTNTWLCRASPIEYRPWGYQRRPHTWGSRGCGRASPSGPLLCHRSARC